MICLGYTVTCLYCRQKFDREKEPTIRVGNRYAHKECAEKRGVKESQPAKKNLRKCLYCGGNIDLTKDEYCMARQNRYAHLKCYHQNYSPDEEYISKIYAYLKEEVHIDYDYPQCEKQRISFIQKLGYTNEEIYNSLRYFYGIKKAPPEKSGNRIGIVPYVRDEAKKYFSELEKRQKEIAKNLVKAKELEEKKVRVVTIGTHIQKPKKMINIDELGEDVNG